MLEVRESAIRIARLRTDLPAPRARLYTTARFPRWKLYERGTDTVEGVSDSGTWTRHVGPPMFGEVATAPEAIAWVLATARAQGWIVLE